MVFHQHLIFIVFAHLYGRGDSRNKKPLLWSCSWLRFRILGALGKAVPIALGICSSCMGPLGRKTTLNKEQREVRNKAEYKTSSSICILKICQECWTTFEPADPNTVVPGFSLFCFQSTSTGVARKVKCFMSSKQSKSWGFPSYIGVERNLFNQTSEMLSQELKDCNTTIWGSFLLEEKWTREVQDRNDNWCVRIRHRIPRLKYYNLWLSD